MNRDWIAYVLLPAGVAGVFVGGRMASGGDAMGWVGLGIGLALAAAAYVVMRPAPPTVVEEPAPAVEPEKAPPTE